jgi:hypothetical protein
VPEAVTEKLAVWPTVTARLAGCAVIAGATTPAVTVRVAAALVALPTEFVTTTVNWAPLSVVAVAGVV